MGGKGISPRQLYIIYVVALLSPAVALLPKWTVATAGKGAWLTGLVAFVPMVGVLWLWGQLVRPGVGMAQAFQQVLGKVLGKALTILYIVWVTLLFTVEARAYAGRMVSAGYERGSMALFLGVMLVIALWIGRKKLAAFARMAEVLYLVLVVTLVVVLAFALVDMEPRRILPVEDAPGILAATLVPCALLSLGVLGTFLWEEVDHRPDARGFGWLLALCVGMTLVQLGVLAQLGTALSGELSQPFLQITRGIGVAGAFQRIESLVMAIVLWSDFGLLCLLLYVVRAMAGAVMGEKGRAWAPWALTVVGFFGALSGIIQGGWVVNLLLGGSFILGIGVPGLVWMGTIWGKHEKDPNI